MRVQWIDEQLRARGQNRRQLADAMGFPEPKLSKIMNGSQRLTAEEADGIRRYFGYRLPDDPPQSAIDVLMDKLARLDEHQVHHVALYLEALTGAGREGRQAS